MWTSLQLVMDGILKVNGQQLQAPSHGQGQVGPCGQ
jgi:hypothetical protein